MAEVIRRSLEREPIVVPGESRLSLSAFQRWQSRLSTGQAPNWAEAMEEDMLGLLFMNAISDRDRDRDRDHCQFINSKDEPLILTGPKRGLAMLDGNYVETDLKIRDHQGQDRELSKGVLIIKGIVGRSMEKCEVQSRSLDTRLSTVKMVYAVVVSAVEATIAIEVVEGEFCGTVTAHTTGIKKRLLLYDSQVASHKQHAVDGRGPTKMMRPVICVSMKDELIITAKAKAIGGKYAVFTIIPKVSRGHRGEFTLGTAKMRLQVDWSIMDPCDFQVTA